MTELNRYRTISLGLSALIASAILGLGACAIQEGTDPDGGGGIVVTVSDTSTIDLTFDQLAPQTYSDSGEFNLDEIRARLDEKGIKPDSVKITGLNVTYDASTAAFLTANKGVRYSLKIYTREGLTDPKLLTLYTGTEAAGTYAALSFDPEIRLFELYSKIFPSEEGFPGVLMAIKDLTKHKIKVIAELTMLEALKTTGALKLNLVVSVAGKV
jgi:hypothetical protein